jgi:hypothetical protein
MGIYGAGGEMKVASWVMEVQLIDLFPYMYEKVMDMRFQM